jgi:hypothetical protein
MIDIVLLLDESYSMAHNTKSYINGINTLLHAQKQVNPGSNFSLIKFSTSINTICIDRKMHTLPEFTSDHYKPDGVTALYDAIGHVIKVKYINDIKPVIVIILTDGEDNNSSEYNLSSIVEKITHVKNCGWTFVYIAANQNAQIVGNKLGIETCLTYNETDASISHVADACSVAIGHAMYKWSGVPNQYCNQDMPTDVRDLTDELGNFSI